MIGKNQLVFGFIISLLPIALAYQVFSDDADSIFEKRPQNLFSFKTPFYLIRGSIPFWTYGGNAIVTEEYLRLTPEEKSSSGYVWTQRASNLDAWEVEMDFKISGHQSVGADGMAFWYIDQPTPVLGPTYGGPESWKGLGVLIDTFDNDNKGDNPSIGIYLNDGTWKYSMSDDGFFKNKGICRHYIRNTPTTIKVQYYDRKVSVFVKASKSQQWIPCAQAENVDLPAGYNFGLTAMTGGVADNHDVYSFSTRSLTPKGQEPKDFDRRKPSKLLAEQQKLRQASEAGNEQAENREGRKSIFDRLKEVNQENKPAVETPKPVEVPPPQVIQTVNANSFEDLDTEMKKLKERNQRVITALSSIKSELSQLKAVGVADETNFQKVIDQQEKLAKTLDQIASGTNSAHSRDDPLEAKLGELNTQIKDTRHLVTTDLEQKTKEITSLVSELHSNLHAARGVAHSAKQNQDNFRSDLSKQHQAMTEVASSSGIGFWTYLMVFQLFGGVGYMYWKKIREEKNKKLY